MKSDFLHLAFAACTLVLAASGEELLPKFLGVGVPLLLGCVLCFAVRRPLVPAILFAATAGGLEDALSSLAPLTSVGFFLILTVFVRMTGLVRATAVLAYPCYQLWLSVGSDFGGGLFARLLVSLPMGFFASSACAAALGVFRRKAGLDE